MERCDVSSVLSILRRYIGEHRQLNQIDLLYELFASFLADEKSQDFDLDNGQVCRWLSGQARLSPRISGYYLQEENRGQLSEDIASNILPLLYDSAMAMQEIYYLVVQDSTISEQRKDQLCSSYPCEDSVHMTQFLTEVLCFAMERSFIKRSAKGELPVSAQSPALREFVFGADVPKPCRFFCGRDEELAALHTLLTKQGKVFLSGIPGIGKSELARAYAWEYRSEYTNILHIFYTGDLSKSIAHLDFADDLPSEDETTRLRRHNRFLRTLGEDTLLIVDHFNTTAAGDPFLDVVLKYRCRVLFTTRSHMAQGASMEVTEISQRDTLLRLMGCYYAQASQYQPVLEAMLDTLHRHTLALTLAAQLLECGILEPKALLHQLQNAPESVSDTINSTKDGQTRRATYYDHLHTLFALYRLSSQEHLIMESLCLTPTAGLAARTLGRWLRLPDLNTINELEEKGWLQLLPGRLVVLHPMMREVAMSEWWPSVTSCATLLEGIREICLRHGEEIPSFAAMAETVLCAVSCLTKDDAARYLRFLEDVFPRMEQYHSEIGMKQVSEAMTCLLLDDSLGTPQDRALLLDYRAAMEKTPKKAIRLEEQALAMVVDDSADHAWLASNIHANLGGLYRQIGQLDTAIFHMEAGIALLERYGLSTYHDSIPQIINYAILLAELGQQQRGLSALQKLSGLLRQCGYGGSRDASVVYEAMGSICLMQYDAQHAVTYFNRALACYAALLEPPEWEEKRQELQSYCLQAGVTATLFKAE